MPLIAAIEESPEIKGLLILLNTTGNVIYGGQAVEAGLIDSLGSLSDALDCLHKEIEKY